MESPLFSLTIDPVTKSHLSETARWAKFLAITGMIFLFLMILLMTLGSTLIFSKFSNLETSNGSNMASMASLGMAVYMIIIAVIWFFPLLFTLRFANGMKRALAGNDQQALNTAFQNLKVCMRYLGIITIVILAIYAIIIVVAIITAGMA
jgi:hypothetical protein